jgi:hypothetical protein
VPDHEARLEQIEETLDGIRSGLTAAGIVPGKWENEVEHEYV